MTMPPLPTPGYPRPDHPEDPPWTAWAQAVHNAAAAVTTGRLTDEALRAAFVAWAPKPNGVDDTTALQAALDTLAADGGVLMLRAGTYRTSAPLLLVDYQTIRGAGYGSSLITASHAGAVIASATPGARTYAWAMEDLLITGPGGATAGSVGIDLESVSSAALTNVTVSSVETGIRLRSAINGGAVYNNFVNVKAQACVTGFSIEASGSNSNRFLGCRANGCTAYGLRIVDSNANVWIGGQIEVCGVGVSAGASGPSLADSNQVTFTRFENNTKAWEVLTADVRYFQLLHPQVFGTYTFTDNGTSTMRLGAGGAVDIWLWSSARQDAQGSYRFGRTANGGSETPAFVVSDSNTAAGTPVTHQVETERATGYFYRGKRGGATYWDVSALDGSTRMPLGGYHELTERTSDPAAPAANAARLYLKDNGAGKTQLCVRFASGVVQIVSTEP